MIVLTAEEAGRALQTGTLKTEVAGVSTDTRSLRPGDLFVALRGERFDGHDYVEAALEAGACGAVVECGAWQVRTAPADRPAKVLRGAKAVYLVDDTLEALGALAREVRRKSGVRVLAVTGSAGKTSTKDILGAMVAKVCRVVVTSANQNNEVGVPLTLLQIEPDTEAVIVEMGMRGRGQIAALARVAEPDVGIITNIHPVHLELLGSLESIAEAKAELIQDLKEDGVAVVPLVCEPLEASLASLDRRLVRFVAAGGLPCAEQCADVLVTAEPEQAAEVQTVRVRWPDGKASLEVPVLPRHTLQNLAAAAAACYAAGLPLERCLPGFLDSAPGKGRGEFVELPGLCLIDDTYNANPAAVRMAIDNLVRVAGRLGARPVVVLGDMRELGPQESLYHRQAGEYAATAGVEFLWGVGDLSEATVEGFGAALQEARRTGGAGHVRSPEEISSVAASLRSGDVVLFKASRSVGLEMMVDGIAEQARAGRWSGTTAEGSAGATAKRPGPRE
jgi:UDP-N-acetylmuramoyl-tripeptide--D-alanyl-D-alanine ligase